MKGNLYLCTTKRTKGLKYHLKDDFLKLYKKIKEKHTFILLLMLMMPLGSPKAKPIREKLYWSVLTR